MPKDATPPVILRYTGLFDFDGLYAAVIDWAKHYNWWWHEKVYKHKVPNPLGAEQEMKWELEKKITDYIKYVIKIEVIMQDLTELEVEVNGKTKSLSNGKIFITMNGVLMWDWQKRFEGKGRFVEWMGNFYNKVIFKKELESVYGDQLFYRIWNLHAVMKKFLDMQTKKYAYKGYLGEG